MRVSLEEILKLSVAERLELVGAIWDSIAADARGVGLSPEQREELRHRLDEHYRDPSNVETWGQVREKLERDM